MHLGYYVMTVDIDVFVLRRPQRDVEHGAILGRVDFIPAEHRIAPGGQSGFAGETDEQLNGLVRNAVLGIIQVQSGRLSCEPRPARRIVLEKVAQVDAFDRVVMRLQSAPGRALS